MSGGHGGIIFKNVPCPVLRKVCSCRVGLGQLEKLFDDVLDGDATLETIEVIERTARSIFYSADCASAMRRQDGAEGDKRVQGGF